MSSPAPIRTAPEGRFTRRRTSGGPVDLFRTVVQANVELGQAQLQAIGAIADSLLATSGQIGAAVKRPMLDAAQEISRTAPVGRAAPSRRMRRVYQPDPGGREPWGAEDFERAFVREAETTTSYLYAVDLPGVVADDVLVEVGDGSILIDARRPARGAEPPVRYETSIWVPEDADLQAVAAELEQGVLHLEVTRREPTPGRQVKVEVRSGEPEKKSRPEGGTKS